MSEETLSKEYIEQRLEDWKSRISSLYSSIEDWLAINSSYSIKKQTEITMYEELMQQYGIDPTTLMVLDIYYDNHIVATIKPIGLWIIGANGRVDILRKKGTVILVDKSETFQKPNWIAYSRVKDGKGESFNRDYFYHLLGVLENEHI